MHIRSHMGIGVQRKRCVGVAQDARQGLGIHAAGEGMGGKGMPQIVETDAGQTCPFQQGFHVVIGGAGGHGKFRFNGVREYPLGRGALHTIMPFSRIRGGNHTYFP